MSLIFEWDDRKAAVNRRKHRISFEEATTAFGDPLSLTIDDERHSQVEARFVLVGMTVRGRLVVVAHTVRGDRIRLISARRATKRERKTYEQP